MTVYFPEVQSSGEGPREALPPLHWCAGRGDPGGRSRPPAEEQTQNKHPRVWHGGGPRVRETGGLGDQGRGRQAPTSVLSSACGRESPCPSPCPGDKPALAPSGLGFCCSISGLTDAKSQPQGLPRAVCAAPVRTPGSSASRPPAPLPPARLHPPRAWPPS